MSFWKIIKVFSNNYYVDCLKCLIEINDCWLLYILDLFVFIGGFDSVIMHFRCKLGMSKITLKQIANIKEFLNLLSINHQISFLIFYI
jgi:hypothetical protein